MADATLAGRTTTTDEGAAPPNDRDTRIKGVVSPLATELVSFTDLRGTYMLTKKIREKKME